MAEKHSEHIGFNYISKLLNIDKYNTTGNKELFGSKIPDGWLLVNNSLLIIEYRPKAEMKTKGIQQLARYAKLAITNKPELTIYCFLGLGTDVNSFEKIFMLYNPVDNSMNLIDENKIKAIFSNITNSVNCQSIHNMLVKNYKLEDAKDLHDMLTIIVVSILDDDFRKYYELSADKVDKEFITDLVNLVETKITDSTVNHKHILEKFKHLPFHNSFAICKTIYDGYKANPKLIGQLFQQFKKYNDYVGSNNEIWTPPIITELMYKIGKKYTKNSKHLTVLDPCIGFNALIYPWIQNDKNITVKGCEISSRLYFMGKLDLMIKGITEPLTYCRDFMDTNSGLLKADICVCNPPYTRNISNGYDCLDFVIKSLESSDVSIFIFPKNRLTKNKKLNEDYLTKCKMLEVIELGNNIFKGVGTGDIVIIVSQKLNPENANNKTKYYNMSALSSEFKNIPHSEGLKMTEKGKQMITDYVNSSIKYIEYTPTIINMVPQEQNINRQRIKENIIGQLEHEIININSLLSYPRTKRNLIIADFMETIEKFKACDDIISVFKLMMDYDDTNNDFKYVHILDIFEQVKFKALPINGNTPGDYPLYGASKDDEPVTHTDKYTIDTKGDKWMQLNKDGSAGYCFVRSGKFSLNSHCLLLKPRDEYKNKFDLMTNINIISLQISNMGFGFSNAISADKLNSIRIYVNME